MLGIAQADLAFKKEVGLLLQCLASVVCRVARHGHFTYQLLNALQSAVQDTLLGDLFGQIQRVQSRIHRTENP